MENLDTNVQVDSWQPHQRHKLISVLVLILIVVLSVILIPKIQGIKYKPIKVAQTQGIKPEKFSISPDNKWLVFFEYKYPFFDQYNFIALNLETNKRFVIDTGDIYSGQVWLQFQLDCWSQDSKYCVLPPGKLKTSTYVIEHLKSIQTSNDAPWIQGNLLTVSQFAEKNKSVGLPNNAPDIILDFSDEVNGPVLRKQFFDSSLFLGPKDKRVQYVSNRTTFDEISPNGFTCSDCNKNSLELYSENDFYNKKYVSPNSLIVAELRSHENGWGGYTSPELYVNNIHVASNVYYHIHYTSDSSKLFFYNCGVGGYCGDKDAVLYYIDLSRGKVKGTDLTVYDKDRVLHTEEEAEKALKEIQDKEKSIKLQILKVHYDLFVKEFSKPQKIIAMNGGRFFTQNHYMFYFANDKFIDEVFSNEYKDKLYLYLRSLVGKTVKVEMPTFEEFSKSYIDFSNYAISHGREEIWGYDSNGNEVLNGVKPISDPTYNEFLSVLRGNVYLDGKIVNSITN